jgi:hypothetical protein
MAEAHGTQDEPAAWLLAEAIRVALSDNDPESLVGQDPDISNAVTIDGKFKLVPVAETIFETILATPLILRALLDRTHPSTS